MKFKNTSDNVVYIRYLDRYDNDATYSLYPGDEIKLNSKSFYIFANKVATLIVEKDGSAAVTHH